MADAPVVHIGENSPEQIAFKLMLQISAAEKKGLSGGGGISADRSWIIRTYCMCLSAVKQPGYPDDALQIGGQPSQ